MGWFSRGIKALAPKAPVAFKRDATLAMTAEPGNQIAYIAHKYPPAGPNQAQPYFVAASAIKRNGGDRDAARRELQQALEYSERNVGKKYVSPLTVEQDRLVLAAVDEVDPIFFDDDLFNQSMEGRIRAGGAAAMERIRK